MWKWLTSGSNALLRQNAVSGGGCGSRRFAAAVGVGRGRGRAPDRGCCCWGDAGWGRGARSLPPTRAAPGTTASHPLRRARAHTSRRAQRSGQLRPDCSCTWACVLASVRLSDSPSRLPWSTGLRSSWVWPPHTRRRAFSGFRVWSWGCPLSLGVPGTPGHCCPGTCSVLAEKALSRCLVGVLGDVTPLPQGLSPAHSWRTAMAAAQSAPHPFRC